MIRECATLRRRIGEVNAENRVLRDAILRISRYGSDVDTVAQMERDLQAALDDRNRYVDLLRLYPNPRLAVTYETALVSAWLGELTVSRTASEDVWTDALGQALPMSRADKMRVAEHMKALGWLSKRVPLAGGRRGRLWLRSGRSGAMARRGADAVPATLTARRGGRS
jgi:hypothetical protein